MESKFRMVIPVILSGMFLLCGTSDNICFGKPLSGDRINVVVSILPQQTFVEKIGGDRVTVSVMVGPGHSPATYEPSPKQLIRLSGADLYFSIGVPFEKVWMKKIISVNPRMKVTDMHRDIKLRNIESHKTHAHIHHESDKDPHVWLSPPLVKVMCTNIFDILAANDPGHREYYANNLKAFTHELELLDQQINNILGKVKQRKFLVFHPSWGYFADTYGLVQVPVEVEGKEASAKEMVAVIEQARKEGIRAIFVQRQFSRKQAESIAREIDGEVISIDPLASAYGENLQYVAHALARVLR